MRVMLTSCGLETEQIKEQFLRMLGKAPDDMLRFRRMYLNTQV